MQVDGIVNVFVVPAGTLLFPVPSTATGKEPRIVASSKLFRNAILALTPARAVHTIVPPPVTGITLAR